VVGAACARAARLRGLSTILLEPGPPIGAASPASAGMLAAQIEVSDDTGTRLFVQARGLYADLAAALEDSTGVRVGLRTEGTAALALDPARGEFLKEEARRQRTVGLRAEWVDGPHAVKQWPGLTPHCLGVLFSPDDGAVDPLALTRALTADAIRLGASVQLERAERVAFNGKGISAVHTPTGTIAAGSVVVAAGAWSPLLGGLPQPPPIEPVRGQLAATAWPDPTPPVILYHEHCYVLPRGAEAILGSTMERVGFNSSVTEAGVASIVRSAVAVLPALTSSPVTRTWAGLRPMSPDGRPVVGRDPVVNGLLYATGHGRNGVLLAALTGDVIGELIATGTTAVDIASWKVDRFHAKR
jgi:glycine oxidase